MMKCNFFLFFLIGCFAKLHAQNFTIQFNHFVNDAPLVLDSGKYVNNLGQDFLVSKLKYYISHIVLTNSVGKKFADKNYYLVDEADSSTKKIELKNIPKGIYKNINFMVGVDSTHNCSGIQTGALDPANGMFWTWNTGYIFLKLEGKSTYSPLPMQMIEYHIGGYKKKENAIKKINLAINTTHFLKLKMNVAELFKTPETIDFAKLPAVMDTKNGSIIANNYADMFSVILSAK